MTRIDFGVHVVEPAGYVCGHGNGPAATKPEAIRECPECMADLKSMRLLSRTTLFGPVWRATGRYSILYGGFQLVRERRPGSAELPRGDSLYRSATELERNWERLP